ncbi:hypothetical protein [Actinoplanes philippinensis]|uniref:hypothetical protein n=1 Tax=Actinoplanes philippinensis TaxID=35752 RepID=UPI003405BE87
MNEIQEVIERKAALLETGDAKAILSHYAPGFVEYNLAPPLRQPGDGRDPPVWRPGWTPSRRRPAAR